MFDKIKEVIFQLKNGILHVFSANVLNRVLAMISNMIITRLLSSYEYGIYSYVLNIYSYLLILNALGLLSGVFQFGTKNEGKSVKYSYFKYSIKMGVIIDSILIVSSILWIILRKSTINVASRYVIFYIPILLLEFLYEIFILLLRCEDKIKNYTRILNFNTVVTALGTCTGAISGIKGIIIGRYIGSFMCLGLVIVMLKPKILKIFQAMKLNDKEKKELWHYSIFTGMSSAINTLVYLLDVSMIAYFIKNPEQIALYKVATLIPTGLSFIPVSVMIAIIPKIIANQKNGRWLSINLKKVYFVMFIFNAILCSILITFATQIITIISGKEYLESVPYFRILVIGYFLTGTFRTISIQTLSALEEVKLVFTISVFSCLSDIILNIFMIKNYGTIGAAFATLGTIIITSIISFIYLIVRVKKIKTKQSCFKE